MKKLLVIICFAFGLNAFSQDIDGNYIFKLKLAFEGGKYAKEHATFTIVKNIPELEFNYTLVKAPTEATNNVQIRGGGKGSITGDNIVISGPASFGTYENGKCDMALNGTFKINGTKIKEPEGVSFKGIFDFLESSGKSILHGDFTASTNEISDGPELTFPLGESPKIFDKGWTLGAIYVTTDNNGEQEVLSDQVEWSSKTATFNPVKGKETKPEFKYLGKNKITLTVNSNGQILKKEFEIQVVSALKYAHVGTNVFAPAVSWGCIACPHFCTGPILEGNAKVLIKGLPAACVGNTGVWAADCNGNMFEIIEGDKEVLIEGKAVAREGSKVGQKTSDGFGNFGQVCNPNIDRNFYLIATNEDLYNNAILESDIPKLISGPEKFETHQGGMIMFKHASAILRMGELTKIKITDISDKQIVINLEQGSLNFIRAPDPDLETQLIIFNTEHLKIIPQGTIFSMHVKDGVTSVLVNAGVVNCKDNNTGQQVTAKAGQAIESNGNQLFLKESFDQKDEENYWRNQATMAKNVKMKLPKAVQEEEDNTSSPKTFFIKYKYYIIAGLGLALLIILVVFMAKRRKRRNKTHGQVKKAALNVKPPTETNTETIKQPELPLTTFQPPSVTTPKFCPECGNSLRQGAKFCNSCGFKLV